MGSTFLLSGLVKCYRCKRALTGRYSRRGTFPYYVCHSFMKRGPGGCDSPKLNARRFEELIVSRIRSSILTDGNIGDLTKVVVQELNGVIQGQRKRLETIESELAVVRRRLERLWDLVETTDVDPASTALKIEAHRERQRRLEASAAEATAILSQRRTVRDDVEAIAAHARDMTEFLKESELPERRALIETFVREIVVTPDIAVVRYSVPMADDSRRPGQDFEEVVLGTVMPDGHSVQ